MLRCAITAGALPSPAGSGRRAALLDSAARWAADGIDFVQLREKDLESGDLVELAESMLRILHGSDSQLARSAQPSRRKTRVLVNGRADVAIAARADGVHLSSHLHEITPAQVRKLFARAGLPAPWLSVSCHTLQHIDAATRGGVDLILFGPVFEKRASGQVVSPGLGLDALHRACVLAGRTPVLALGGVTLGSAQDCIAAGAAGIAGIRLFA